jgi:hypothetical protein
LKQDGGKIKEHLRAYYDRHETLKDPAFQFAVPIVIAEFLLVYFFVVLRVFG